MVAPGGTERTRCCSRSNLAWWVSVGKGARVLENAWVDAESVSHTWELLLQLPFLDAPLTLHAIYCDRLPMLRRGLR